MPGLARAAVAAAEVGPAASLFAEAGPAASVVRSRLRLRRLRLLHHSRCLRDCRGLPSCAKTTPGIEIARIRIAALMVPPRIRRGLGDALFAGGQPFLESPKRLHNSGAVTFRKRRQQVRHVLQDEPCVRYRTRFQACLCQIQVTGNGSQQERVGDRIATVPAEACQVYQKLLVSLVDPLQIVCRMVLPPTLVNLERLPVLGKRSARVLGLLTAGRARCERRPVRC